MATLNFTRFACAVAAFACVAVLFGCEKPGFMRAPSERTTAEIDAALTALQKEVTALKAELVENRGKWVLWRAIEFSIHGGGNLSPKPIGAHATKQECERAGEAEVVAVAVVGQGKVVSALSYTFTMSAWNGAPMTAVAVFRCLPDTVNPIELKAK